MTAHAPITSNQDAFHRAECAANEHRGRLVNLYAKAESSIAAALLNGGNKLPMLFSHKIKQLKDARASDKPLLAQLAELEALLDDRNSLVHGDGSIWINRRHKWLLRLRHQGSKGIVERTLCEDESAARHDSLRKLVQSISDKLKA